MKGFLRFLVGIFFIFLFILFLGLSAVRFRLLNPQFWGSALDKAEVYVHLEGKVQELQQLQRSGKLNPQQQDELNQELALIDAVSQLDKVLTADKIQELIEENLERVFKGHIA